MQNKVFLSILSRWSLELNATLLKNNSLCVGLFDANHKLLFANASMAALFKGDPCESFINPSFEMLLSMHGSDSLIFEGFITFGDYSSVNTSISAQVYRKENELLVIGGVNALQLIEQNKTMHQLNREIGNLHRELIKEKSALESTLSLLNEANNSLKQHIESKDRIISILAHDLKGSFSLMLGFLELVLKNIRNYDIDTIEKQIMIINDTTQSTFNLLEDILLWAGMQSGNLPYEPERHDISAIFKNVIEGFKFSAENKGISINLLTSGRLNVYADINMINTVLRNLISNAIKFSNPGGSISLDAKQIQKVVTISVTDKGVGLRHEVIDRLFDGSHKISTEGTAHEKGTGLGLLLCKEFIDKHGGRIWVESELGKGSSFKFTLQGC